VTIRVVSEAGDEHALVSGPGGVASEALPPAFYDLEIAVGCTDGLEILGGATGKVAIPPGEVVTGELSVQWRHRFGPGLPTRWVATDGGRDSVEPPLWRSGVVYDVSFAVVDRCDGDRRAPGVSFDTFRFTPSGNAGVSGAGEFRADAEGWGHVQAFCTDPGVIELSMTDATNPDEPTFDLLVFTEGGSGRPSCDV